MSSLSAKLNLALILVWATASEAAVFEVRIPVSSPGPATNARFLHWQATGSDAGFMDNAVNATHRGSGPAISGDIDLLHVANAAVPRRTRDSSALSHYSDWKVNGGLTMIQASREESAQSTEIWPIIIIAAGLVAYQLRRQTRNRSGFVRIPSGRP